MAAALLTVSCWNRWTRWALVSTTRARIRFGSWVATPTGHVLVWQRWDWMHPTAIIMARAALV